MLQQDFLQNAFKHFTLDTGYPNWPKPGVEMPVVFLSSRCNGRHLPAFDEDPTTGHLWRGQVQKIVTILAEVDRLLIE